MTTISLITLWTLALMSPGLDFAVVTKNALTHGVRAGVWTAFGVAVGLTIHFGYTTAFLGSVSITMKAWMWWVQLLGALFLLYLAYLIFRGWVTGFQPVKKQKKLKMEDPWMQGFLTNVLNPKVGLLSISLFSSYIQEHSMIELYQLYGVFIIMTFVWFSFVSIFWNRKWLKSLFDRYQKTITVMMGLYFVFLGGQILYSLFAS